MVERLCSGSQRCVFRWVGFNEDCFAGGVNDPTAQLLFFRHCLFVGHYRWRTRILVASLYWEITIDTIALMDDTGQGKHYMPALIFRVLCPWKHQEGVFPYSVLGTSAR